MKLFLDDERSAPEGWVRVTTAPNAIGVLHSEMVTHLSLDHDLGDGDAGNGYDVVLWIEEQVMGLGRLDVLPVSMKVHSANPPARARMEAGIERIEMAASEMLMRGGK